MKEQRSYDIGRLRPYEFYAGLALLLLSVSGLPARLWAAAIRALCPGVEPTLGTLYLNLAVDATQLILLASLLCRFLKDQLRRLSLRGWLLWRDIGGNLLGYFGGQYAMSFLLSLVISVALPDYRNQNQELVRALVRLYPGWGIVLICLLAPVGEELLYRGIVFAGLYPRSRFLAYAVSMGGFAAIHVLGFVSSQPALLSAVNLLLYLVPGFFLARCYERSGSIFASILMHSTVNAISMALQLAL